MCRRGRRCTRRSGRRRGTGAGDDSVTPPTSGILVVGATGGSKDVVDEIPLDSSRRASYAFDVAPVGAAYIYMAGYIFER